MIPQGLYQDVARSVSQDNERKIAAKELRRLAKLSHPAAGSSHRADRIVAAWSSRVSLLDPVIAVRRSVGQVLVAVLRRHVPA